MRYSKLGIAALFAFAASSAHAQVIYTNDFSTSAGSEWSNNTISTDNGESFLATSSSGSGNGTDTLTLTGLPSHSTVTVGFDLYLIQTWDGNGPNGGGADFWGLNENGNPLLLTTFANYTSGNTQDFVSQADPNGGPVAPRTGEFASDHLGFGTADFGDATYRFLYTFNDSSSALALAFTSFQNQSPGDEGWGLDNVSVTVSGTVSSTPEPGSVALLMGLGGSCSIFALRRRSRKRA